MTGMDSIWEPVARWSDPDTSHAAARDAKVLAGPNRRLAYEALCRAGERGLTDFELAAITGVAQTSIGVRRKELVRAGYVEATPLRRPAPSGSMAIVWRVKA
jgi:DNA-binding transcriptional ArsR family regulator